MSNYKSDTSTAVLVMGGLVAVLSAGAGNWHGIAAGAIIMSLGLIIP